MTIRRRHRKDGISFEHRRPCRDPRRHRHCPGLWRGEMTTGYTGDSTGWRQLFSLSHGRQAMAGLWWLPCTQRGSRLASWQAGIGEFADGGCGLVAAEAEFAAQEAPGGKVGDRGELSQLPAADSWG